MGHRSKYDRILSLYTKIMSGDVIRKSDEAADLGVNERTIQQTVGIFENIFGERNVLGHYGTADFGGGRETGERSPAELAAENWDKPIIVTTNVQFFESLHAAKPSHCRKLHSVADSVIIFDEAQMLPVGLLRPCLRAISELVKNYGCTAVLCTATQPALERLLADNGITAREICPDTARMYPDFARVRYEMLGKCSDDAVCERLRAAGSALCVLNSRAGVRSYYNALAGDGVFHLSTYMTPAHLGRSIETIRERLGRGEKCLVVSTSLIEAGVDVDFPTVFREMAGLDSIIQAGGRCNREGRRATDESNVYVLKEPRTWRGAKSVTPCNNLFRPRSGAERQPHFVLLNVKREYRRSSTIKKPSKKPRTWRGSFYLCMIDQIAISKNPHFICFSAAWTIIRVVTECQSFISQCPLLLAPIYSSNPCFFNFLI